MDKEVIVKKQSLETVLPHDDDTPGIGHNGGPEFIREKISQILHNEEQKKAISANIRQLKADMKEKAGINTAALNQILREMKMEEGVRRNFVEDTKQLRSLVDDHLDMFDNQEQGSSDDLAKAAAAASGE
ncbi:MAG: hypothetical protein MI867_12565 [Pseudomonadales bacterium]|nr:hypothetical protein [Pseudomonadales bacterium]